MEKPELFSYHIFMFPFKWEDRGHSDFDLKRTWGKGFGDWERKQLTLDAESYNEYNYFYPHVREVMYDLGEDLKTKDNLENDGLIRHYEYQLPEQSLRVTYNIECKGKPPYQLKVDSIHLNIYSTGTGILVFHLRNFLHPKPEDIIKINQFGRRIYPPFFSLDKKSVITGEPNTQEDLFEGTKKYELADKIWLEGLSNSASLKEDYSKYLNKATYLHGPFRLPAFISGLFPAKFFYTHRKALEDPNEANPQAYKIYLRPVLDDRMFVICWYGNDILPHLLKRFTPGGEGYAYTRNDWWYRYVLVDGEGRTLQNQEQLGETTKAHTYARWVDSGTLYGMSRYSLVMLTGKLNKADDEKGVPDFLVRHLQTLYYKMAELSLVQRATVLSYADKVTHVSDLTRKPSRKKEQAEVLDQIEELYSRYILFVNKIHFREVTAQEQGIEMYRLLQQHMNLDQEVSDLDSEIEELHNYARLASEKRSAEQLKKLTVLGGFFLPLGFFASLFGLGALPDDFLHGSFHRPFWSRVIGIFSFSILFWLLIRLWLRKK